MSFFKTLSDGIRYMEKWPEDPLLSPVFPENRVKYVMKIGRRVLPPFIVLTLIWAYYRGGGFAGVELMFVLKNTWPMTLVCVLFLLLMPLQGYYWFGKRAHTPLNSKLKLFYIEMCKNLQKQPKDKPNMQDFCDRVNEAIKLLGRDFLRKL